MRVDIIYKEKCIKHYYNLSYIPRLNEYITIKDSLYLISSIEWLLDQNAVSIFVKNSV